MESMSHEERRSRLARRHYLAVAATDVTTVARDLIGLHSSDPTAVYLSCRARLPDFTVADLETALYDHRTLLRLLGMRRTMFVVTPEVAAMMNAACTRSYLAPQRRRLVRYLEDQGVTSDGDAWLAAVEARTLSALHRLGEATANELREVVPELQAKLSFGEGKTWGGQVGVSTRVLFLLATGNRIVRARPRGSWISSQYRWALFEDWYPEGLPELDVARAQQELAERWLHAFGPGTLQDLKWWTGWGIAATRRALEGIGAKEIALEGGETGYVHPADGEGDTEQLGNWVALLPSLDPTVMGWKDRRWYVSEEAARGMFDRNGNAGATIWVDGRVVGGWAQASNGIVRTQLIEALDATTVDAIEREVQQLERWLGDTRITPRFRTPLEKRLLE
jgi:hypothetical protein